MTLWRGCETIRQFKRAKRNLVKSSWWQSAVIYQIYPRSFQDSNGDGIGDLAGIERRLDYCVSLGVDAVWLSPIYPSPMADFGYDISNYTGIAPIFGTMQDFDRLLAEIKRRSLRLILDYVPNHTSNQHPWFEESRSSRDNPRRGWYLWRDPSPDGSPPNNWLSNFGGSAWEWDSRTQQFYYHSFLSEQPDLNWRNPEVIEAMHDVLRFWLKKGVDGFRIDVLWMLIKDDQWRDNPPSPQFKLGMPPFNSQLPLYTTDRPEVQSIVSGFRLVTNEFENRVLIGEIYLPLERLMTYYGKDLSGVQLPFNFQLLQSVWDAAVIANLIEGYESALPQGGWPNWVLGNHDNPRVASRVGTDQARIAAMLLLTLRGTPTMYYGDELGMLNVPIPANRVQDPFEKNVPGKGLGRDPSRTPMLWDRGQYAGFSTHPPWLPVTADFASFNVEHESGDPNSILALYRALLGIRHVYSSLSLGAYARFPTPANVLGYLRNAGEERLLIVLNFSAEALELPLGAIGAGRVLLSTHMDRTDEMLTEILQLRGNEGLICFVPQGQEQFA
jgi:alpha-glucosidase